MSKEQAPFTSIYLSVGGWKAHLIAWDEEIGHMVPVEAGLWGYPENEEGRIKAIEYAKQWAESEEIEYKGPEPPRADGTLVTCSCITGKRECIYCGGIGKVRAKVVGTAVTEE